MLFIVKGPPKSPQGGPLAGASYGSYGISN